MKFIVPLIALTLSACSFEPCAYDECLDEAPCLDCVDMGSADSGKADVIKADGGHEEDAGPPIDMSVAHCLEAEFCGVNDGSPILSQAPTEFFGCRRFENSVISEVTATNDTACNDDRHQFDYRPCENASFILEATLTPAVGCSGAIEFDVLGADFSCSNEETTRCEIYPDGTQTVQILVRPEQQAGEVFFVVRQKQDLKVDYTLRAKAYQ